MLGVKSDIKDDDGDGAEWEDEEQADIIDTEIERHVFLQVLHK